MAGLVELWARHLIETVQSDGQQGFSRFNLGWKQKDRSLEVAGHLAGRSCLRQWVYGTRQYTDQGYVKVGNEKLLRAVARAHCRLALASRNSEPILVAAARSVSQEDFEAQQFRIWQGMFESGRGIEAGLCVLLTWISTSTC